MDLAPQMYALAVPEGVVTYNLCHVYDDDTRHVSSHPAHGLLHRQGHECSVPLERQDVEQYIANHGTGRRLQASP
jgi:hypothetical protein